MAYFDVFGIRTPGKGVEKKEYTPRFPLFFDILWRKLWMICKTNLLHLLCCLPVLFFMWLGYAAVCKGELATLKGVLYLTVCTIYLSVVGFGVIMPGLTFLTRSYARERHVWIFSDYKDKVIECIKQSSILFVVDTLLIYLGSVGFAFYGELAQQHKIIYLPMGFLAVCLLIYFMMHFYIYPIMTTFELDLKAILKDSLIMTVAHFPRNLFVLIIVGGLSFVLYLFNITIGLTIAFTVGITILNYIINFMADPIIDRYLYIPAETIAEREKEDKKLQ